MKRIVPFDDYNCRIKVGADVIGTVLPTWGNFALTNGWKLIEIYEDSSCIKEKITLDLQHGDRQE